MYKHTGKNICIVGTAPGSMASGPYNNPDWEIWACSPGTCQSIPNIKVFFELHRWAPGASNFPVQYVDFLKNFDGRVVMSTLVEDVSNAELLPVNMLVKKYSPYFFTSSIAWMMAMAIESKPKHIALFGVDMSTAIEYNEQRPGCHFFALIAKSLGIQIGVPPESDLFCPPPLYGICQNSHSWIKQSEHLASMQQSLSTIESAVDKHTRDMHHVRGAIDEQTWQMQNWQGRLNQFGDQNANVTVPSVPAFISQKPTEMLHHETQTKTTKISKETKKAYDYSPPTTVVK